MRADPTVEERLLCVSLDVFSGPLDLLLNLVREQRLDIASVSLARVADQYFSFISAMQALDVELAAEYLVIAATLVFLKSKALLPPLPREFEDAQESAQALEERLRERLIVYSHYREAGRHLGDRALESAAYYVRPEGGDPSIELLQRYCIDVAKLAHAFTALRVARPQTRTIVRERVSVLEQMEFVMRTVRRAGTANFFALIERFDRAGVIMTFLAVLELVRRGRIVYQQENAFADIELRAVVA